MVARAHPLVDITRSDSENNAPRISENQYLQIIELDLEYLMEISPSDPLLGVNVQGNSGQYNRLPDVTVTVTHPDDTLHNQITGIPSPADLPDYSENEDTWTPGEPPTVQPKPCIVLLKRLNKIDMALWCHPTWSSFKENQ